MPLSPCGNNPVNVTSMQSGYILSQGELCNMTHGKDDLHHSLKITDIPFGNDIVIDFIYLVLGCHMHCVTEDIAHDVFRMYINNENNPIVKSGDPAGFQLLSLRINTASADNLTLEFAPSQKNSSSRYLVKYHCKLNNYIS